MTVTDAPTDLLARVDDYRFDVRCELMSHNLNAVSYGKPECDCRQCLMLRPVPTLLAELADGIRCRTIVATLE